MTSVKQYMVVEKFQPGSTNQVYERLYEKGRMLPEGLFYINSWLESDGRRCFQIMETADRSLFDVWIPCWEDLVEFEIVELGEKPKEANLNEHVDC